MNEQGWLLESVGRYLRSDGMTFGMTSGWVRADGLSWDDPPTANRGCFIKFDGGWDEDHHACITDECDCSFMTSHISNIDLRLSQVLSEADEIIVNNYLEQ